ncbi:hypothetical protein [Maridesulfovibrio sp. FT414]|uniref:hypothetical protein n=1 Tax=Maridesulfovibrio sp. FT414 TaxID=2979469 RepID=UPI003D801072
MRNILILIFLFSLTAIPAAALCSEPDLQTEFSALAGTEAALKTLSRQIDTATGAEKEPDRIYAMQDMAGLCKSSRMQVHSLNSLFSVVKLVKMDQKFQSKEAALLKMKCGYAYNDFTRRQAFVQDIMKKAADQSLLDLAYIFDAQLKIVVNKLKIINSKL